MLIILLFIIGIGTATFLIARKIWQLRSGRIAGPEEEADWHDLSIETIRTRLLGVSKFSIHHFTLLALKAWIKTSHFVRRGDQKVKAKLTQVLHKNGHYPEGGAPSEYIKTVREHKDEIKPL